MLQGGYPGVYVQDVPSGVRTVTGAPTSNLAVVGQFPRGPVGVATRVNSWSDVERTFGGLDSRFEATYALQEFFLQGGSIAYVTRVAFQQASAVVTVVEPAMTVRARTAGAAGNSIRISITHNPDGTFNLLLTSDGGANILRYDGLTAEPGAPNNAALVVNSLPALGGSPLIAIEALRHRPAAMDFTLLTGGADAVAADDDADDDGEVDDEPVEAADAVRAALAVDSVPLPALTFQATEGGVEGNALTVAVSQVNAGAGTFSLTFAEGGVNDPVIAGLSIDPASADYVVTRLAASPRARVLTSRGPVRLPDETTGPVAFAGGGAEVPIARATMLTAAGTAAIALRANNAGQWGNNLRVGAAANPNGGFDLLIAEFQGTQRLQAEAYRGLNVIPGDPNNVATVVNAGSRLVVITAASAPPAPVAGEDLDGLELEDMLALTGGQDGVLPGDPAWAGEAIAAFQAAIPAFDRIDPEVFNLMIIPEAPAMADLGIGVYAEAAAYCDDNLAFLLVDNPRLNNGPDTILGWPIAELLGSDLARSAALCFPQVLRSDPLNQGRMRQIPASGSIAGLYARIDGQRGVWKTPAGAEASLAGLLPSVQLTDLQQGRLNQRGLNVIRAFPNIGTVNWGGRTLAGADALASEWKYVSVMRTALFLKRSLKTSLNWVVFEPNDEPLWAQIRLNVGAFMQDLFIKGAFAGTSPAEAYLVKCDSETTSQQDVNSGIVNILVGFQPLKPAEFVVLKLTQLAGRLAA